VAVRERLSYPAAGGSVTLFALVTVAYAAGAELSWQSFSSGAAFGFPPAGVTVAAMLLTSRRRWPAIIAAIVIAEVGVDLQHGLTLPVALVSAAANVVEPVVGASLVRRWCGGVPDLTTRGDLLRFIGGAVLLGPAAGALIGATVLTVTGGGSWPEHALQWVAGDGIAVLVIGGPILLWARRRDLVSSRWPELVLLVTVTAGLSVVAFRFGWPSALLLLPLLAWGAFRLGDLGVVLAGSVFACVANYMTAAGYGEFAHLRLSSSASLALTQVYIAVAVLTGWLLAQEISGRLSATADRDAARRQRELADARRAAAELDAVLAEAATVGAVGAQVSTAVRARVGAAHVVINVLASDGQRFEQLAGEGAVAQQAAMTAQWTIASDVPGAQAARDRVAVYLPDLRAPRAGFAGGRQLGEALGLRSAAAFPLLTEAGALGYLGVGWKQPHETTTVEREYLQALAQTTSRALERARLRQAERQEQARIETLAELTKLLAGALTPEEIGTIVSSRVRMAVGAADAITLGLISQDRDQLEWICIAGYSQRAQHVLSSLPLSAPTAVTDAARSGRPVIIESAEDRARRYPGADRAVMAAQGSSWLAWPLSVGSSTVGSIGLLWKTPQRFGPGRCAFIAAVADLIAQALVRARRYADEHAIATALQGAVTPHMSEVIAGLDAGACYRQAGPARAVGGDWYDMLALPGQRVYLAVGDVVGHGIAAAEDMTQLRNAGRTLAFEGHQPASLLRELSGLTASVTSGKFATMNVAILDRGACLLTYACAGHPPMLIRRAATGKVQTASPAGGPALGAFESATYTQRRSVFHPGDLMLMYTDGLVERPGGDIDEEIARVGKELQAWQPGVPLDDFCRQLVNSLAAGPQLDDICVLAVRRFESGGA
jgi:serine phosphatase RsbU (regulator of sigma subunit)/integral membrane sensor domain MASE1